MKVSTNLLQKFFVLLFLLANIISQAQTVNPPIRDSTQIRQYAIYAEGNHKPLLDSVNYGVQIKGANINGGLIGSNFFVNVSGSFLNASIYSGNRISISSATTVRGDLAARNDAHVNFDVIQIGGSGVTIGSDGGGLLQARGNVAASVENEIGGPIYIQNPYKYNGPQPVTGGIFYRDTVAMPTMPALPFPATFPSVGKTNVTNADTIGPGSYANMILTGTFAAVTFSQPGVYVFKSIKSVGLNNINFVFPDGSKDLYRIYVYEDVDLGPTSVTINGNGPDGSFFPYTSQIYTEVHGTGSTTPGGNAFHIKDTSVNAEIGSFWAGTVYAPNGSIAIGTINAPEDYRLYMHGALWSKTKITIGDNVIFYNIPLDFTPVIITPILPPLAGGKTGNKIGAELTSLNQNPGIITTLPKNVLFRIDPVTNKVLIEVIAMHPDDAGLLQYLLANGFQLVSSAPGKLTISGYFPIDKLQELNSRSDIDHVRPMFEPINNVGQVTTQGDLTMRSNAVRSRFGIEGNGVKVGVMSDSYNTLHEAEHDIQEGDIPADMEVVNDFTEPRSDEGRAMAQIVYDIAPKAKLVFRSGCITPLDFALGIQELAGPLYNCDVIVDDITYITEPFLKDGLVAQAVNDVVAHKGVTYITSAGNFGSRSFEGTFSPLGGAVLPPGIFGVAHNFGGSPRQTLHLKRGTYTLVLQWDDNFYSLGNNPGAAVDLDIFLIDPNTGELFGFNRNNIGADPIEVLPFNVNQDTNAELLVVKAGGAANVKFKIIMFRGEGTFDGYAGSSTIVGQADAEGAITVGAILYDNVNGVVPDYPSVATFSSKGGTTVDGVVRLKPDVVAPNGVNTTVTLSTDPITNIDGDVFPNFFGTSASAPHAAGVAALLIEGRRKFNLDADVTPEEIKTMLTTSALPLAHSGPFDFKGGAGSIQADSAMLKIANARPVINSFIAPPGLTPDHTNPFLVTIIGKYLNSQTKVYIRGAEVPTTFVTSNLVRGIVSGPISDDPAIQLYNPPKSPSGLDGGLSEALHFFSNRQQVIVKADNKTKKFGEALPAFTFHVTIDGTPLGSTTETLASLKLDGSNVQFATLAGAASNVANYSITPSRAVALNPAIPADAALLAKYTFQFEPGTLTVQKLPVKITPQAQTITYGNLPGLINYNYDFGGITIPQATKNEIDGRYRSSIADNTFAVVNGLPTPVPGTTLDVVNNMSTMASFQSMLNARKFILQNGQLTPVTGVVPDDKISSQRFLVDLSSQSLTNYDLDSANIQLVPAPPEDKLRGLVNARALANGDAQASLPNGQLRALVNGPLLPVVNGQLQALVSGQLRALVNGVLQDVADLIFYNGQLRALVNGSWIVVPNGQIQALVNGVNVMIDLSIENGQLRALVNGQLMALVNGQLQAVVNGQTLALVNGQLQALVSGQFLPVVNGQLRALVNGQLRALVNGQMLGIVDGELVGVEDVEVLPNGQLRALVNGQLRALVNGQLFAVFNSQLFGMTNGQLMAVVNGHLNFVVFNGQLRALVNGSLEPVTSGQLRALVNGSLQNVDNVTITNGQLRALVNGQEFSLTNGQLRALVNGQLQGLVNNFGGVTATNNSNAAVIIDGNDILVQDGVLGGLFAINTITGLNPGAQKLIPATFFDPNLDISYGLGDVNILPGPTDDVTIGTTWYRDFDKDGFGNPNSMKKAISQPVGYVSNRLDCNDYKITYEDKDNDGWGTSKMVPCSLISRKGDCDDNDRRVHSLQTYYRDEDGDSYGDRGNTIVLCSPVPPAGYVANTIDCDDHDPKVKWPLTYYQDLDGDGLGNPASRIDVCLSMPPQGYVKNNRDTDDGSNPPLALPMKTKEKSTPALTMDEVSATAVYPNPAHDKVRIYTDKARIVNTEIIVYDANGKAYPGLHSKKISDNTAEVIVTPLAAGIYLVQVKTSEGMKTLRFTKL